MKKLLCILGLVALTFSARAQSLTQGTEYPWRVQITDLGYTSGSLTAVPVTVFYRSDVTNGSAVVVQVPSTPATLQVDLIAKASSTVTVSGTTYTYGQIFALMNAIFVQERSAQLATH